MKIKTTILILFLFIQPLQAQTVEIQSPVTLAELAGVMNKQIERDRMPKITMQAAVYVVISAPSKRVAEDGITCAEIYYDANEFGVIYIMQFFPVEFSQVTGQPDGLYTLAFLRPNCIEGFEFWLPVTFAKKVRR